MEAATLYVFLAFFFTGMSMSAQEVSEERKRCKRSSFTSHSSRSLAEEMF